MTDTGIPPQPHADDLRPPAWFVAFAAALVALGAAGLTGSSWLCAIRGDRLFTPQERAAREIYGSSRSIRSDEWAVETPQVRAQQRAGFPLVNLDEGIGELQRNPYDIPVLDWGVIFRPLTWPYFLQTRWSHGLRWFLRDLLLLAGVYALLAAFTGDPRTAAIASVAVLFSSAFVWWRSTVMIEFVGFLCLTGGVAIRAVRKGGASSVLLTGYCAACSFCVFYPPVWAPMLWVVCAAVLDEGLRRRRLPIAALIVLTIAAGAVVGLFYHLPYLSLAADTAYPGRRTAHAGGLPAGRLLDLIWPSLTVAAPVNCGEERYLGYEITNACEAAAVEVIPAAALVAMALVDATVRRAFATLVRRSPATVVAFLVLGAWLLLPLPDWFGALTLLKWSPALRAWMAFGISLALMTTQVLSTLRSQPGTGRVRIRALVALGLLAACAVGAREHVRLDALSRCQARAWIPPLAAAVLLLGAGIVFAGTRRAASLLLAAWAGSLILANHRVNPLVRSEALFSTAAGHRAVEDALSREPGRILDYSTHPGAELNAFGWPIIGGVQNAPDLALFRFLAPDSSGLTEDVYNRYAHYSFVDDPRHAGMLSPDSIRVFISPCSARLAALGVNHLLAADRFRPPAACEAAWTSRPAGDLRLWSRRVPVCAVGTAHGAPAGALDFDYACPAGARLQQGKAGLALSVPADSGRSWAVAINPAIVGSVECTDAQARWVDAHLVVRPAGPRPECRARYLDSLTALRRLLGK